MKRTAQSDGLLGVAIISLIGLAVSLIATLASFPADTVLVLAHME